MCGLFGGSSPDLYKTDIDLIKQLGLISTLRGMDSSGIGIAFKKYGNKNKRKLFFSSLKAVSPGAEFIYSKSVNNLINSFKNTMVIMGHTRAATVGDVNHDNAHPYSVGHIIGAHNGTIYKFDDKSKNKTDSLKLMELIAEKGIDEALTEAGSFAHWAVTYLDTNNCTLNLCRNKERPLAVMFTEDGRRLFWASDPMFLELMRIRSDLKLTAPKMLDIHKLYTWDFNKSKWSERDLELKYWSFSSMYPKSTSSASDKSSSALTPWDDEGVEDDYFKERPRHTVLGSLLNKEDNTTIAKPLEIVHRSGIVDDNSIELAKNIFPIIPASGYPRVVEINKCKKILRYFNHEGKFINADTLKKSVSAVNGCLLSGRIVTIYDEVYWFNRTTYVMRDFIDDPLIQDHIRSQSIKPTLGFPVYISFKLLHAFNTGSRVAMEQVRQARKDLMKDQTFKDDPYQFYGDPSFADNFFDEEVRCG